LGTYLPVREQLGAAAGGEGLGLTLALPAHDQHVAVGQRLEVVVGAVREP
jgi:hypothetical protein